MFERARRTRFTYPRSAACSNTMSLRAPSVIVYPLYERAAVYRLRIGATAFAGDLGDDSALALGSFSPATTAVAPPAAAAAARSDPCSTSPGIFK